MSEPTFDKTCVGGGEPVLDFDKILAKGHFVPDHTGKVTRGPDNLAVRLEHLNTELQDENQKALEDLQKWSGKQPKESAVTSQQKKDNVFAGALIMLIYYLLSSRKRRSQSVKHDPPSGLLVSFLMPPKQADDYLGNLEDVFFPKWVKRHGVFLAKAIWHVQCATAVGGHWASTVRKVLPWVKAG